MAVSADFRVGKGFFTHFKTGRLMAILGETGAFHLLMFWSWATEHRPEGVLTGMTPDDIEFAAGWKGERGIFFSTLLEIGWLDMEPDGTIVLHEWQEHNPWVAGSTLRADQGRMGKLASNYPEIYRKYADAGVNAIDKATYEREIHLYKERKAVAQADQSDAQPIADTLPQPTNETAQSAKNDLPTANSLRNSGDPTAPIPEPVPSPVIEMKEDHGDSAAKMASEKPINEPQATAEPQKPIEKPIFLNKKDGKPISWTDIDPKITLAPGEVEDIHPLHVPEGMTVEEVREIRRGIRAEEKFASMALFLQYAELRTRPFAIANQRREEAEATTAKDPMQAAPVSQRRGNARERERNIQSEATAFRNKLAQVTELYHQFPGYAPTKGETQWLVTLCQGPKDAIAVLVAAKKWVDSKAIHVKSARGFLSSWWDRAR